MSTNTPLNYCNFDFEDLVLNLQNRLKTKGAWSDLYRSGTGEMLIEFLAYVGQLSLYYTERRAQESFLPLAQLRSSLVNIVSILNYQPKRKSSAKGTLTFTLGTPRSVLTILPKYTECQTADKILFVTNESATIQQLGTVVTVAAIQGRLIQKQFSSNGSTDQEYIIHDTAVENSADIANPTFRVIVDGSEWTLVSSFLYSAHDATEYRLVNEMDGKVSIHFGDNINGASPENGATIQVQYIRSDGLSGNVTTIDKITAINVPVYDALGVMITDLTVTNDAAFLGGDDEEGIEEIRYEAPRVFKTGDRAVNREDFIAILENYPGIACINVWGENEEAAAKGISVDPTMLNKAKIVMLLQNWILPDMAFQTLIGNWLYQKSMMTVRYEWVLPVILEIIPTMYVSVNSGYSISQAETDINAALNAQFVLGTTTRLGTTVKYSQVVAAVQGLLDVDHVNMVLEIKKSLSTTYASYRTWGAALDALNILPESVKVYVDDTYLCSDENQHDGTGTFTASGLTGTVDYVTGEVLINRTPAGTAAHVRYQQDSKGDVVPTLTQIAKLTDNGADFVSITMRS